MTRHVREHDVSPRRRADAPQRVARESQPPERLQPSVAPATLTREARASAVGNGRVAHELTATPYPRVAPDGAGNGAQIVFLEPLVITARDPNEPHADDIADAEEAYALDMASIVTPESDETAAEEPAPQTRRLPTPEPAEPVSTAPQAAHATTSGAPSEAREGIALPSEQEVESESATQEEEAEAVAETEAAALEMEPEVIEMEPAVIEARTPARARGGGAGGPDPRVIVQRWRSGVAQASSGMPRPTMAAVSGGPAQITEAAERTNTARSAEQEGLPEEAAANIEEPPELEEPPAPPESNPIPEHTDAIQAASDKRLPDAQMPRFVQTPVRTVTPEMSIGGNWPKLGERPVPNQLFQILVTQGREALAEIPADREDPERQTLEHFREVLETPIEVGAQLGDGETAPLVDEGPQPIPPLPEGMATPVVAVVTRLLAAKDSATRDVLVRLRRIAFPRGVLAAEYPDIGDSLRGRVGERMETELREIADAAGVGGAELDQAVDERRKELEEEAADAEQQICTSHEEATESVSEGGQETLNVIEGVRQSTDEQIIDRQEQATGGNDPAVVNARRDLVIRWIGNHVTTQTTNYQKAGEKREKDLNDGKTQRVDGYNALAQREEYQMLHPRAPLPAHDRTKPEVVRHLDDLVAAIRAWTRERVGEVGNLVSSLLTTARDTTRDHRSAIETAGTDGINAARTWAEDRILEGQSWWERFKAKLERWFGDSQDANEQWYVRRTEETRNGIANDLNTIGGIQAAVANGATKEQLLQTRGLTDEQRSVITEYFDQPAGTHPLDIAAAALRQRLATQYLTVAKPVFEAELIAKPDADHEKLTKVARSLRAGFDGAKIAQDVHAQIDSFDSDEAAMLRSLEGLSALEGAIVRKVYRKRYGVDLDFAMSQAFDYDEMDQARLRLEGNKAAADAAALDYAMGVINTDEKAIMDLLRSKTPEEIEAIRDEYRRRYGKELDVALVDNLDEGNEQDQAAALIRGDRETADAIAIDEAMRGGMFGWGTEEEDIEATYKRVHDEVLAQAQREGWSSAQMQAEIRRRTQGIEARFGERYANVEEYQAPGLAGDTVLRRAISSEMDPGPERNLANALASNDTTAADAARIEIERRGLWSSDEAINNVLTNQYERALEETRLDQAPARQMRVDRLRRELRSRTPPLTPDEESREVMAFERQMESEMADEAQRRSHISMDALEQAYQENYWYPLSYTLGYTMSGTDLEKARALKAQGGRLTALQTVEFATQDLGTDEDPLRTRLSGMTKAEIDQLRRDWEARHPGESFDDMLRGELSGRDESDIMDIVEHGAPESAKERIAQERRRTERELGELTGLLGGAAAGNEEDWLREQMRRLEELKPQLDDATVTDEARDELFDELDFRVERVQQAVEDHRRAIDSVANLAAQVASLAVAITVGAALTFLSGGALGPVMIAVIASVAATLTTMGTKALVQGGSYGGEDIGVDLAIGVVDALTAAATAGMGGRILRGATGVAQAAAQPTRLTRFVAGIGRTGIAQRVARSRAGQVVGRAAARANQAEVGFLARGIKGENVLARMARGDSKALRIMAEGLAEGIENAVGAFPSAFTQTALSDETWKGDPLANLIKGTATGVGMGVALGGGMQGVRALRGVVGRHIRLSTAEGRVAEGNRILGDAFQQHRRSNPEASYDDFLNSAEGLRARAEVEQRGLIGEQRTAAARAAEPDAAARGEAEAPPRALDEATEAAPPSRPPEVEPPRTIDTGRPAREQMPEVKSSVPANETRVAAEAPAVRADEAGELAPRPDAEAPRKPGTDEAAPSRPSATDPASQALRDGLPAALTERIDVRVNPDLDGNTVRVIPDPQGGPRAGVRVEAGPGARPIDVLMHAHTVQSMQRYNGLLGRLRALRDWFYLTNVGSRGWEAKLELEKLPGIIHERMQRLSRGDLDLASQARLLDEISELSRQIDGYQRVLESPSARDSQGRGFVAAETSAPRPSAEEPTAIDAPAPRPELPDIPKKLAELPADRRQALEERMAALDDALRASDAERFRVLRDEIAGELGIPGEVLTEALYLPRTLRPDWDASQLLPQDQRALATERFLADKNRRAEMGARVAELKRRLSNEPIVRELVEGLAKDLSLGEADLIFNEMVDWIIAKGRIVDARLEALTPQRRAAAREQIDLLQRLHAEQGSSPEFKQLAESLARELGLKRGVLEQEILPGYSGRRPGAKRLVDILRGMAKERGVDLDGFVLRLALEENIAAIATIRERLRTIQPDSILAVDRGGVFLADTLAHGSPDIEGRVTRVPKADDNSRAPHMEAAIRDQIVNGKKTSFAIVDFYMGGGAAGEFLHMIERILADHPQVRFEVIWMRERHGFERLGDAMEDPGVQLLPFHETPDQLRGRVQQTSVEVRIVLGDDMAVVFGKSDTDVITIVDRYGRIIQKIPVGTRDPDTGEPLDAKKILIRLLNGVEFAEASR